MNSKQECIICQKHTQLEKFTGEVIAERGGWMMTHFPYLEHEKSTKGHLLIETKRHITDLAEMNESESSALGELVRLGVQSLKSKLNAEHVYMFRINDLVAHLHVHLVPRYPGTPREYWGFKINEWSERETLNLEQIQSISRLLKN